MIIKVRSYHSSEVNLSSLIDKVKADKENDNKGEILSFKGSKSAYLGSFIDKVKADKQNKFTKG